MITKRTLTNWRRDALTALKGVHSLTPEGLNCDIVKFAEINERILRLTQELIDQYLTRKE